MDYLRLQSRSIGRILYARLLWLAIIPLGTTLLLCSSHLPAYLSEPPVVIRDHTHAYLVLLRVEVAAFHPALSDLNKPNPSSRLHRNGVCPKTDPHRRLVSVALVLN